jgi:ubiquinone/menaquinone biosynthesis C-methylase UbiE
MAYSYDSIPVGFYDEVFHRKRGIQSKWHHHKFRRIIREIGDSSQHLDFGCGPGTLMGLLPPKVSAIGVDIAEAQITYAREHYRGSGKEFIKLDSERLPFPSHTFDSISCIEVIEHLDAVTTDTVFAEFLRVLKPSGKLIVTTPNYASLWPALEQIVNRLSDVSYEEQHISKFKRADLDSLFSRTGFSRSAVTTFMSLSPFVAGIDWNLADRTWEFDQVASGFPGVGLLLLGTARP